MHLRHWRLKQPIRASPKFAKANSIVWMIPNEWPGAWMPLGRVCVIGFGKRGPAGSRAEGFARGYLPLQYQRPKAAKRQPQGWPSCKFVRFPLSDRPQASIVRPAHLNPRIDPCAAVFLFMNNQIQLSAEIPLRCDKADKAAAFESITQSN